MFSQATLDQLRHDWELSEKLNLPENPRIVVAGAYQGKLMCLLAQMYPHHKGIDGYEPQMWAARKAMENTQGLGPLVIVHSNGLLAGKGEQRLNMGEWETDACSVFAQGEGSRQHDIGLFVGAITELSPIMPIDLFVMNMEGYEYKLLPYLIGHHLTDGVQRIAVQFHTRYVDEEATSTLSEMDSLYERVYNNYAPWVYWVKR